MAQSLGKEPFLAIFDKKVPCRSNSKKFARQGTFCQKWSKSQRQSIFQVEKSRVSALKWPKMTKLFTARGKIFRDFSSQNGDSRSNWSFLRCALLYRASFEAPILCREALRARDFIFSLFSRSFPLFIFPAPSHFYFIPHFPYFLFINNLLINAPPNKGRMSGLGSAGKPDTVLASSFGHFWPFLTPIFPVKT